MPANKQQEFEVYDVDEDAITPAQPPPTAHVSPTAPYSDLEQAELLEPTLNIQTQFKMYNRKHFSNGITNTTVEYSTRMTLCAGTCTFRPPNVRIALSEPLLKFRPRSDLLSTLLHEMIHAFLFLTEGLARDGPDGHGPMFMSHACRINATEPSINISPYHEFRSEVDHYRVHHWRCKSCQQLIKRAMNRAPGPADQFWPLHQRSCGGEFVKIAGPPKKEKPVRPPKNRAVAVGAQLQPTLPKGVMKTFRIDDMLSGRTPKPTVSMVNCPVCAFPVKRDAMNSHLDICLAEGMFTQPPSPPRMETPAPVNLKRNANSAVSRHPILAPKNGVSPKQSVSCPDPGPEPQLPAPREKLKSPIPEVPHSIMHYIADPDALYDLALAPKRFPPERVDSLFRNLPPSMPDPIPDTRQSGIADFLDFLVNPDSPRNRERLAKEIIEPLERSSDGQESSLDAMSNLGSLPCLETGLVAASQVTTKGAQVTTKGAQKRPRSVLDSDVSDFASGFEEGKLKKKSKVRRRGAEKTGIGWAATSNTDLHARQITTSKSSKRPTDGNASSHSGKYVGHEGFHGHPSTCLAEAEFRADSAELGPGSSVKPFDELEESYPPQGIGKRPIENGGEKSQKCPICDINLSRKYLEAHVASCMMSSGLADAF